MSAVWDPYVPAEERERLSGSGFGTPVSLGKRPALVVVDVVMSFLGRRPGDEEGMDYATSCGEMGWRRLPLICSLLESARAAAIPRVLTKGSPAEVGFVGGAIKLSQEPELARATHGAPFPDEITPRYDEFVIEKTKASSFFQTPLLTYFTKCGVDSLIVAGATTSGCVRATVVDAISYGYPVLVAEDACFDRSPFAHAANLFDIQMKYGTVTTTAAITDMLASRHR